MSVTRVTSSPISDERYQIELPGGRFSALVRPPNFDELAKAGAEAEVPDQMLKLFELCAVEPGPKLTNAAKRSIGVQIHEKLTGEDFTAVEISEHELTDDAADALEAKRKGNPNKEFVCLSMDDKLYVLFAPDPSLVDNLTKRKSGAGGMAAALTFVDRHLFFGDLETLKRDRPSGVLELCRKMCEIGGVSMQGDVKKA